MPLPPKLETLNFCGGQLSGNDMVDICGTGNSVLRSFRVDCGSTFTGTWPSFEKCTALESMGQPNDKPVTANACVHVYGDKPNGVKQMQSRC